MKKTLVIVLALVLAFAFTACGAPAETETPASEAPASEAPESETPESEAPASEAPASEEPMEIAQINAAYHPNYAGAWAYAIAQNEGYFAEQGLEVTGFEFTDGPTEISAMTSGSIDVGYIGDGAHRLPIEGTTEIFALSQISEAEAVIGLKSAGVETLEDLKGKRVGYSSGTSSENILSTALESVGMTLEDVEAYDMDAANMVVAMTSGSLDACATWVPNTFQIVNAMNEDAHIIVTNADFLDTTISLASWVVGEEWAAQNRDVLVRFTKAIFMAMDFGAQEANQDKAAEYVAQLLAVDKSVITEQVPAGDWFTGQRVYEEAKSGELEAHYMTQIKGFVNSGVVEAEVPLTDYIMLDVMLEAGEALYGE